MKEEIEQSNDKRDEILGIPNKIWNVGTNTVDAIQSSSFHVQDPSTVYAFEEKAPWVVSEKKNPFEEFKVQIKQNASLQEPNGTDID